MPDKTYQKHCNKCGQLKDASDFVRASASKDGLHWWCKQCFKRNNKNILQSRKANWKPGSAVQKLCPDCRVQKAAPDFSTQRSAKDGLNSYCRDCTRRRFLERQIARLTPVTSLPPDAQKDAISPEYVAGFFDGEGNVAICKAKAGPRPAYYTFHANITNTNLEVLTRIQQTFGGSIKRRKLVKPYKQQWVCRMCSWDAHGFLLRILPFLIVKRRQAEVGIQFQQTMRHPGNRWGPTPQEEWDRRETLYQTIRRLNGRKTQ